MGTSLHEKVTINTQGIQEWSVPISGTYKIEAWGARGGDAAQTWLGAYGAFMSSEFYLTAEDNLKILVGQKGSDGEVSAGIYFGGGGGGASFIHLNGNVVLISGGGGGAGIGETGLNGFDGSIALTSESGNNANGTVAKANGLAGTNGSAGTAGEWYGGAGGASVSHSGEGANYSSASGGTSWMLGGTGGLFGSYSSGNSASGGFGGGGASLFGGGGGGGYSGGAAGTHGGQANATGGGGGGSFNSGTNQNNQAGANAGHGKVVITLISSTSTESGGGGYESDDSGYAYDDINITYPNVYSLYSNGGNGLTINWDYQSQDNGMQSLKWAYKLDEDFYGTSTSATQVDGNDSVDGTSWLSGVSYGTHTLYVALLDQADSSNVLSTDSHSFDYQEGDGSTQTDSGGYQSDDSGYQSDDGWMVLMMVVIRVKVEGSMKSTLKAQSNMLTYMVRKHYPFLFNMHQVHLHTLHRDGATRLTKIFILLKAVLQK